jgi:hypothetical protein
MKRRWTRCKKLGISKAHLCDVEKDPCYPVSQLGTLALQAELDAAGLKLRVNVEAA